MVWGIFSWHSLGPLVPIEHRCNATAYLSIVADHVHPFMTTMYPTSDGYFQQDNAPCHKAGINCVMPSCQYGPKSLRNASSTLLNLCHEELRQF
ncbi:hypothetical protein GDO81_016990 [Engystomops pustulosus]|uniref:Tc1-like transposase DDE domain-containing protein n=1 Tax=Engystomops pustulosus TaxID=76066 RepID=A0AAV7AK10_ENGPU|nr:hypothetical protein GDO81_016990 [Engystomops pustulosus]